MLAARSASYRRTATAPSLKKSAQLARKRSQAEILFGLGELIRPCPCGFTNPGGTENLPYARTRCSVQRPSGCCCARTVIRRKSKTPASRARRRRTRHGPYFGAGVWLKAGSSATQVKFAATLVLPLPLYFATLG